MVLRVHGVLHPPGQSESESLVLLFHVVGDKVWPSNLMILNIKEGAERRLRIW